MGNKESRSRNDPNHPDQSILDDQVEASAKINVAKSRSYKNKAKRINNFFHSARDVPSAFEKEENARNDLSSPNATTNASSKDKLHRHDQVDEPRIILRASLRSRPRFGSDITPQLQHMNSSKLYSEDTVDESSLGDKSVGSLGRQSSSKYRRSSALIPSSTVEQLPIRQIYHNHSSNYQEEILTQPTSSERSNGSHLPPLHIPAYSSIDSSKSSVFEDSLHTTEGTKRSPYPLNMTRVSAGNTTSTLPLVSSTKSSSHRPYSGSDPSPTSAAQRASTKKSYKISPMVEIEDQAQDRTYQILPENELYNAVPSTASSKALATSTLSGARVFFPSPTTPSRMSRQPSVNRMENELENEVRVRTYTASSIGSSNTQGTHGTQVMRLSRNSSSNNNNNRYLESIKVYGAVSDDEDQAAGGRDDESIADNVSSVSSASFLPNIHANPSMEQKDFNISASSSRHGSIIIKSNGSIGSNSNKSSRGIRVIEVRSGKMSATNSHMSPLDTTIYPYNTKTISPTNASAYGNPYLTPQTRQSRRRTDELVCERCNIAFRSLDALLDHCQFSKIHQIALMEEKSRQSEKELVFQYNSPFEGE